MAREPSDASYLQIRLATLGISVTGRQLLDHPRVSALAAEDACWRIAHADWLRREPTRRHWRRRAKWRVEGDQLDAEAESIRLAALKDDLLATLLPR